MASDFETPPTHYSVGVYDNKLGKITREEQLFPFFLSSPDPYITVGVVTQCVTHLLKHNCHM